MFKRRYKREKPRRNPGLLCIHNTRQNTQTQANRRTGYNEVRGDFRAYKRGLTTDFFINAFDPSIRQFGRAQGPRPYDSLLAFGEVG